MTGAEGAVPSTRPEAREAVPGEGAEGGGRGPRACPAPLCPIRGTCTLCGDCVFQTILCFTEAMLGNSGNH